MRLHSPTIRFAVLACIVVSLATGGCRKAEPRARKTASSRAAAVSLTLAIVGDPEMATAVRRLRSEWRARTGGSLNIVEFDRVAANLKALSAADALIVPTSEIGLLAARDLLLRVPEQTLASDVLDWRDVFELTRLAECAWGDGPIVVPLGSPVLVCYYRADFLEQLNRKPPSTWQQYAELVELLALREKLGDNAPPAGQPWTAVIEPLAGPWGARVLLARAASYAKHRDNYSAVFQIDTMEPLIAGPPFVRALTELVDVAQADPQQVLGATPQHARDAVIAGHCGLALAFELPVDKSGPPAAVQDTRIGFCQLPGGRDVYNVGTSRWEQRPVGEELHVSFLSSAGRLGCVPRSSPHARQSFALLAWLSGPEWSPRVSTASKSSGPFRTSHVRMPGAWAGVGLSRHAAAAYVREVQRTLSRQAHLAEPRLPGHERYMAALDRAVQSAVRKKQSPVEALNETAAEWRKITAELGVDNEKRAYRRSLGLVD